MVPQMVILLAILLIIITFLTYTQHLKTIIFQVYQREYYLLNILARRRVKVNIDMVSQKAVDSTIKFETYLRLFPYFTF